MADSDSEDEQFQGVTSVLLGYAGQPAKTNDMTAIDNHLGGQPVWLADIQPPQHLLLCKNCGKTLDLLAQLSCPLANTQYDRVIYVFSCAEAQCRRKDGSIRALLGIHDGPEVKSRIAEEEKEQMKPEVGPQMFGELGLLSGEKASNPFAGGTDFSSGSETRGKASSQKKKKTPSIIVEGKYKCSQVDIEEEYLSPEKFSDIPTVSEEATASTDGPTPANRDDDLPPEFEAAAKSLTDPTFMKFIDRVRNNPEQVLRYERGLEVVPYAKDEMFTVFSNSRQLPGQQLFELQLMPNLISELETEAQIIDGMEWGTIVVATPVADPVSENSVKYHELWVGVQWEQS